MCGIAGFASSAPLGEALLRRMTASLAHRGPDGDGFHLEGGVGLGHRRLAIIDVAGGDNPLHDGEGRAALVFNCEIYNHLELRRELEAAGCRPRTGSDGEVILHGYLHWGLAGMLRRLRGMYVFALHDRRRGQLHLARDPLGIKPLLLHGGAEGLLFGSEAKAILAALPAAPPLDRRALLQCATLGFAVAPRTLHEGIEHLPPGSSLTWQQGRLERARHHELIFEPGREAADPEELWARLRASVRSHLMSEVPLGAFLSGGIDSTAVVAAMSEASTERVQAVCVGIAGLDERPFAREAAGHLGVQLHEEEAAAGILDLLPQLAYHLELPFGDTSAAPTWRVCQGARRHVTVALSGDGGDENFAGYRRTRYDVLEERWRSRLPAALRRGLLAPLGAAWPSGPWVPQALRAGTLLGNLGRDWLDAYLHSLSRCPESRARQLLRPEVVAAEGLREDVEPLASRVEETVPAGDALCRVLAMDFRLWLPDDILVKVDRTSMAHGLEVRVPLLDTDFVAFTAGLPDSAKLADGQGKVLFRRALRGRVPDVVLDRKKQGFHLPVADWLRGVLRPRLDELLADATAGVWDWLVPDRIRSSLDEHVARRADRAAELWFALSLDACLRHGPRAGGAPA